MRVVVDLKQCEANGICMGIAPDVFELTEDDELVILQERPDESRRAAVEQAVRQCPKQAISIDEEL
jgi:ferredoxin